MGKVNLEALGGKKPEAAKQDTKKMRHRSFFKEKEKPEKQLNEKKNKPKKRLFQFKKKELNTRSVKFNYTPPRKIAALFIWSIVLVFLFSSFLFIVRQNAIASAIRRNSETIVQLKDSTGGIRVKNDYLSYQGETFLRLFFSDPKESELQEKRNQQLNLLVAKGLSLPTLNIGEDPVIESISFVKQTAKNNTVYDQVLDLSYDVLFSVKKKPTEEEKADKEAAEVTEVAEERETLSLQVTLSIAANEEDFRLIAAPIFSDFSKGVVENAEEVVTYDPKALLSRGSEVAEDKKESIISFTKQFYELYTKNDNNLKLVTSVSGFTSPAQAESISVINLVQLSEGVYAVDGKATLVYENTGVRLPTTFSIELKQTDKSYFVTKVNE